MRVLKNDESSKDEFKLILKNKVLNSLLDIASNILYRYHYLLFFNLIIAACLTKKNNFYTINFHQKKTEILKISVFLFNKLFYNEW